VSDVETENNNAIPPPLLLLLSRRPRSLGVTLKGTVAEWASVEPVWAIDAVTLPETVSVAVISLVLVIVTSCVADVEMVRMRSVSDGDGRVTVLVASVVVVAVCVALKRARVDVGSRCLDGDAPNDKVGVGEPLEMLFVNSTVT
jgi:hypothetical protein